MQYVFTRLRPEAPGVSPGRKGEAGAPRSLGEGGQASAGVAGLLGATGVSPWGSTLRALRDLKRLPRDVQRRLIKKLDWYCAQPDPLKLAEPLVGPHIGGYRFRVGDYRVVCDREDETMVVLLVGHRKDIYRQ